jgi:hypothetical protein
MDLDHLIVAVFCLTDDTYKAVLADLGLPRLRRRTFFGFRVHVRVAWAGVIAAVCLAPANAQEQAA